MDIRKCIEINCEYIDGRRCKRIKSSIIHVINPCRLYRSISDEYNEKYFLNINGDLIIGNRHIRARRRVVM